MRTGILSALCVLGVFAGVLTEAHAWPASSGSAMPISEAQKNADIGDYFSIEGIVVSSRQQRFFTVRDQTGKMVVVIPEYITREQGVPKTNERIGVRGKYDNKKLDSSVKGMRVTHLTRYGQATGRKGSPSPAAPPAASPDLTGSGAASPAAGFPSQSNAKMYRPAAPAELKERLAAKRHEFSAAKSEAEAAGELYADALYVAGDGPVDPGVQARLQQAEARVSEILATVPPLLDEARAAGVSDDLLRLYQKSAGMPY